MKVWEGVAPGADDCVQPERRTARTSMQSAGKIHLIRAHRITGIKTFGLFTKTKVFQKRECEEKKMEK